MRIHYNTRPLCISLLCYLGLPRRIKNQKAGLRQQGYQNQTKGRLVKNQRGKILVISTNIIVVHFDNDVGGHELGTFGAPEIPVGHDVWCGEKDLELDHVYYNLEMILQ